MEYICDFKIKNNNSNILEKIIYKARKIIEDECKCNIKENALVNKCDYATRVMTKLLDKKDIKYSWMETIDILGNDVLGHSFLVVYLDNNSYIVDLTYLQFFIKKRCRSSMYKEVDGVTILSPDPGYYYIEHLDKLDIAISILEKGYVKLDENSVKAYLDSFYLTRRGRRINVDINASIYMNAFNVMKNRRTK